MLVYKLALAEGSDPILMDLLLGVVLALWIGLVLGWVGRGIFEGHGEEE